MKITNKYKFAWLPKRCNKCNTLFLFEWYNTYWFHPTEVYSIKQVKCKRCIK